MKMGELAEALVITRGGLTKLVDRLIKAGLLERTFCETDRRVSYATLLPAGAELLEEMRPLVRAELAAAFSANLSVEQAEQLRWRCSSRFAALPAGPADRSYASIAAARSLADSTIASTPASWPLRRSSIGSGSPLTIPSKNSLRSW